MKLNVALSQFSANNNPDINLKKITHLIEEYLKQNKPDVLVLPEMFIFRGNDSEVKKWYKTFNFEFLQEYFQKLAKTYNINLVAGSIYEKYKTKFYNTCCIINNKGKLINKYRKINLFKLYDSTSIDETKMFCAGSKLISFKINNIKSGILICYDLRFPELFRKLVFEHKIKVLYLVSNFTYNTGKSHWYPLLKARAIENQIFIVAVNQHGKNNYTGVKSFGNSTVIDPWGNIVIKSKSKNYIFDSNIDLEKIKECNKKIPVLKNYNKNYN